VTVALDIWSVGVTLLCFLTRRFPFFASNDDTEALMEIAAIFGKKGVEKCAAVHSASYTDSIDSGRGDLTSFTRTQTAPSSRTSRQLSIRALGRYMSSSAR
jgi:serine/threonine protein kinase